MRNSIKAAIHTLVITPMVVMMISCDNDPIEPEVPQGFDPEIHFNEDIDYGTVTDIDGNEYKTFTIVREKKDYITLKDIDGNDSVVTRLSYVNQTWMAENLRTTKYRTGEAIRNVTDSLEWASLSTGAFCTYNNTLDPDSIRVFGRLYYNYTVTDSRNIAPEGWHVADTADWRMLFDTTSLTIGRLTFEGGKLKEEGLYHWRDVNVGATNETGFTAIPSGVREYYTRVDGMTFVKSSLFEGIEKCVVYWTPTRKSSDNYQGITLLYNGTGCHGVSPLAPLNYNRKHGFSVRCVKDYE